MLYEGKVVDGNDPDGWHPDAAPAEVDKWVAGCEADCKLFEQRIEARVRAESASKIEAMRQYQSGWYSWASDLSGLDASKLAPMMDGELRETISSRSAQLETTVIELNAQLAAANRSREELEDRIATMADEECGLQVPGEGTTMQLCTLIERALFAWRKRAGEAESQLAAAKPVLTDDDRAEVDSARMGSSPTWRALVAIIDRLCPPPNATPSDAEVLERLEYAWLSVDPDRRAAFLKEAIDALRARGGK
jgi:hypothetical protein